jgi:two-component system chemotaxis response regulator CheY
MTSENDSVEINKAFSFGADDYLLKPFNREIIEMKLHDIRVAA